MHAPLDSDKYKEKTICDQIRVQNTVENTLSAGHQKGVDEQMLEKVIQIHQMIIHKLAWLYVGHLSRQWPSQSQASIITKIVPSSENDTSCGLASLHIVPIKSKDKNKIYIQTNAKKL